MRNLVEVSYAKDGELKEGEQPIEKGMYFLLHWGTKMEIINEVGVSYTVAVCQDVNTGEVLCFLPEALKIIGTELKK